MDDQVDSMYLYSGQLTDPCHQGKPLKPLASGPLYESASSDFSLYPPGQQSSTILSADEMGMLHSFFSHIQQQHGAPQNDVSSGNLLHTQPRESGNSTDMPTPAAQLTRSRLTRQPSVGSGDLKDHLLQRLCVLDPHLGGLLSGAVKSRRTYTRRGRDHLESNSPLSYSLSGSPVDMNVVSPSSSSSGTSRIGKSGKPLLSDETKRLNHIESEKNRRQNIKVGFETLAHLVPCLSNDQTSGAGSGSCSASTQRSEALILDKTIAYMQFCLQTRQRLYNRIARLKQLLAKRANSHGVSKSATLKSLVLPALYEQYPTCAKAQAGLYGTNAYNLTGTPVLANQCNLHDIIDRPIPLPPDLQDEFFAKGLQYEHLDLLNLAYHEINQHVTL